MKIKKTFIGYTNFKWLVIELLKVGTVKSSFFSKKRIESGIAFLVGQFGMIYFLLEKIDSLITSDIVLWAATEFAIAGYMINQIQKEKKEESKDE